MLYRCTVTANNTPILKEKRNRWFWLLPAFRRIFDTQFGIFLIIFRIYPVMVFLFSIMSLTWLWEILTMIIYHHFLISILINNKLSQQSCVHWNILYFVLFLLSLFIYFKSYTACNCFVQCSRLYHCECRLTQKESCHLKTSNSQVCPYLAAANERRPSWLPLIHFWG